MVASRSAVTESNFNVDAAGKVEAWFRRQEVGRLVLPDSSFGRPHDNMRGPRLAAR